jgi:pimeloyl-ACP methyl ester carboxylesterase
MAVHIINLRSPQDGNGIAQNPYVQPALPSSAPLILLIHGYNVSLNDARESYASFLNPNYDQNLVSSLSPNAWDAYVNALSGDTLDSFSRWGEVCLVFWPANVWGPVISALAYPPELNLARESAPVLAGVLQALPRIPQPQIALICHSMGNRIALEMLNPSIPCRAMCLMAAAVATQMVTGNAQPDFRSTIAAIEKTRVLYSANDSVLGDFFSIGEALSGEGGHLTAVGSAGDPPNVWTDTKDMYQYGHTDYWSAPVDQAGTTSRDLVLNFLSSAMPSHSSSSQIGTNPGPARLARPVNVLKKRPIHKNRIGSW